MAGWGDMHDTLLRCVVFFCLMHISGLNMIASKRKQGRIPCLRGSHLSQPGGSGERGRELHERWRGVGGVRAVVVRLRLIHAQLQDFTGMPGVLVCCWVWLSHEISELIPAAPSKPQNSSCIQ